jgi:hypothetical protein
VNNSKDSKIINYFRNHLYSRSQYFNKTLNLPRRYELLLLLLLLLLFLFAVKDKNNLVKFPS